MGRGNAEHSPVDRAVAVLVYLPLGMVLELPRAVPRFIERGRSEVAGWAAADGLLERLRTEAAGAARGLHRSGASRAGGTGGTAGEPDAPSPGETPTIVAVPDDEIAEPRDPPPDPAALAIPDYDSLSASQVVRRLDGLEPAELELLRTYEERTRGRRTILGKIAQLQAE